MTFIIDDILKIVYKSCYKILNYFIIYNYSNTSNAKKYLLFFFCLKQKQS